MSRTVFVAIYLATAAVAIILVNAGASNYLLPVALWGLASLLLGWGTGQPLWALLALLAIPIAAPFGSADHYAGHEAPLVMAFAFIYGIGSAVLIVISAMARLTADHRRRARA